MTVWVVDGINGYGEDRRLGIFASEGAAKKAIEHDKANPPPNNPPCEWEEPHVVGVLE